MKEKQISKVPISQSSSLQFGHSTNKWFLAQSWFKTNWLRHRRSAWINWTFTWNRNISFIVPFFSRLESKKDKDESIVQVLWYFYIIFDLSTHMIRPKVLAISLEMSPNSYVSLPISPATSAHKENAMFNSNAGFNKGFEIVASNLPSALQENPINLNFHLRGAPKRTAAHTSHAVQHKQPLSAPECVVPNLQHLRFGLAI